MSASHGFEGAGAAVVGTGMAAWACVCGRWSRGATVGGATRATAGGALCDQGAAYGGCEAGASCSSGARTDAGGADGAGDVYEAGGADGTGIRPAGSGGTGTRVGAAARGAGADGVGDAARGGSPVHVARDPA